MIHRPSLEVNIVRHCNQRCAACSHAAPWAKHYEMTPEAMREDLLALEPILTVDRLYLLGGEPLLHKRLMDMIAVANESPVGKQTSIITNGLLLDRVPEAFWSEIDFLRISVYPTLPEAMIDLARKKQAEHKFELDIMGVTNFYKQFAVMPNADHFHRCPWKTTCLTMHEGYLYLCPNSAFFPEQFMGLPPTTDGWPISGIQEEFLLRFLTRSEPLVTCRICCCWTEEMPWKQSPTREQWVQDSICANQPPKL